MRRAFGFLIILILLAGVGLTIYAYVADLTPPTRVVEAPAVGVGFSD